MHKAKKNVLFYPDVFLGIHPRILQKPGTVNDTQNFISLQGSFTHAFLGMKQWLSRKKNNEMSLALNLTCVSEKAKKWDDIILSSAKAGNLHKAKKCIVLPRRFSRNPPLYFAKNLEL